jgi:hypothetical protein
VDDAEALHAEVAAAPELDPQRRAWLGDQLAGISTYASVLAGAQIPYADEVERCFGVRPVRVPEETFAEAHALLDELLPGDGPLVDRYEAYRAAHLVSPDALLDGFARLGEVCREATRRRYGLPYGEAVETELAPGEPWWAYNYYLGRCRSRIALNPDRSTTSAELVELVTHEAYPGHHTEHASKEVGLVERGAVHEESLLLVPTPQSMVSEGIAENAWDAVLDAETSAAVAAVLATEQTPLDLEEAEAIRRARKRLRFVSVNVALMIHEEGASAEEAQAYTERWSAVSPKSAASSVRFVSDPLWRAYVSTYAVGGDLVRRHLGGDFARFGALLSRQTRVADLAPLVSAP